MQKKLEIAGVPDSLRLDGWWLDCDTPDAPKTPKDRPDVKPGQNPKKQRKPIKDRRPPMGSYRMAPVAWGALGLAVALADWLFWHHDLGISVAVFAMALSVLMLELRPQGATHGERAKALGFAALCNLPIVEQLQMLSLIFSLIGLVLLAIWVCYDRLAQWGQRLWFFLRVSTFETILFGTVLHGEITNTGRLKGVKKRSDALLLPGVVGVVFLFLLALANPILAEVLENIISLRFMNGTQFLRIGFWFVAASVLWPYLNLNRKWLGGLPDVKSEFDLDFPWVQRVFNAAAVRNSLVLFNVIFLFQTVLDLGVLTGGLDLPKGMSYARYAHRGAYPLVVTAILAGVFAISARGVVDHDKTLRGMLFLWLGQNMFLVLTAAYRLTLYVDAYSLTYLRVAAYIWMGLVFVGLVLTIAQILRAHSNVWLIRANLGVLLGGLYLCCFVNFTHIIADHNYQNSRSTGRLDRVYICNMGEQALPTILTAQQETGGVFCSYRAPVLQPMTDWREWGFRKWRLRGYLKRNFGE